MLVNMNDVLYPAKKGKYAVGLFNAVNLELARGIIAAAENSQSPVIMGTAEVLLPYGPLEEVSYYLIPMAKKANVPVVIHLDHGLKKETCLKALELGFSSIMYDCSTDSYEDNVRKVKEMADIAHSYGATIEGELGHVGDNPDSAEGSSHINPADFYTDPKMAKDFVDKTGVDALAIAVGTAHGAYKLPPKLDFERIHTIANTVDVPLVLHGGSGLTDNDFKRAIQEGISKINIFTCSPDIGVELIKKLLDAVSAWSPIDSLGVLIAAIVIMVCFGLITAFSIVALVESYIIVYAGILLMGFGGSRWTKDYAIRTLQYAMSVGAKLYVLILLLGIGAKIMAKWIADLDAENNVDIVLVIGFAITFLALVKILPDLAQGLINGASYGNGSALTAAAAAVGGAAGAAAGMAVGAGMAAKGAGALASEQLKTAQETIDQAKTTNQN